MFELVLRVIVLFVGLYIALATSSQQHPGPWSGYLSALFVMFGLGLTLDGVAKVLRR